MSIHDLRGTGVAVAAVAAIGLSAMSVPALAADALPPVKEQDGIRYRVGGIGKEEQRAMQSDRGRLPLMLTFVEMIGRQGAYTVGTDVTIRDASGQTVFEATADGPLLQLDLPQGRYTIEARRGDMLRKQTVEVEATSPQRALLFSWPGPAPEGANA